MATVISKAKIIGLMVVLWRLDTNCAPQPANINPAIAAGSIVRQGMFTLWVYCQVAIEVPQTAANLLVPKMVANGQSGLASIIPGSKIRPPPPIIESIKPARKAREQGKIRSIMAGSVAIMLFL
jgi:hypothetical protein